MLNQIDTYEEICPFCDEINDFPIIKGVGLLQCKKCGKLIKTCNLCEEGSCENCIIEKEIKERIKENE